MQYKTINLNMIITSFMMSLVELTAKTKNGITSIMISVDLIPIALKNPADPRTERITTTIPEKPSSA